MQTNQPHPSISRSINSFLLLLALLTLVGCANTAVYRHTTSVKARAEQLDVNVLGIVSDVHIQDGEVELTMTTEISLTLLPVSNITVTTAVK
jgi:hypothetical protein